MKSEIEKFKSKIIHEESSDCWVWTASKYRGGYGHFARWIDGKWKMYKAHRFAYEFYTNTPREDMQGLFVCHTCDNPSCVNPKHLYLGSLQDNANDRVKRNRGGFGRDKKHSWLSLEIAKKVRETKKRNPELTYVELAKLFNSSAPQVHRIVNNKIWKEKTSEMFGM
jgi:hypothetical protein